MLPFIAPILPGRFNPSFVVLGVVFFAVQLFIVLFLVSGMSSLVSGQGPTSDALNRPVLASHLPSTLPGWHKRSYLAADGEAITAPAFGRGIAARLAMGEDQEQFAMIERAGIDGASAVYLRGEERIAIGMMRAPVKTPEWAMVERAGAAADTGLAALKRGEVVAIVHGLAFRRRGSAPADGSGADGIGYDRYFAQAGNDLSINVISNAPQHVVEMLLARIDAAALSVQLTTPDPRLDAGLGVILHHWPETWPETWPPVRATGDAGSAAEPVQGQ